MRYMIWLMMVMALLSCAKAGQVDNVFLDARTKTVFVESGEAIGTGVVVNDRCVVTAAHVVEAKNITFVVIGTKRIKVKEVARDSSKDASALCADGVLDTPQAKIGPEPLVYDNVFTIGFPFGAKFVLTEGRYQGHDLMTTPCAPGNSGGGVWDSQGRYVGFVDSIIEYEKEVYPNLCKIIPAAAVERMLTTNNIEYQHERGQD